MKVSKHAVASLSLSKPKALEAVLPLIDDEPEEFEGGVKTSTFKLRTVPADADSPKYTLTIPVIDGTASVRQTIKWYKKLGKIFTGLHITTANAKNTLINELCTGGVLTAYTNDTDSSQVANLTALRDAARVAAEQANGPVGETPAERQVRIHGSQQCEHARLSGRRH